MDGSQFAAVLSDIKNSGRITANDVLALRRHIYGNPRIQMSQIEALFKLNHACPNQSPEWTDLFAEAIADFIVEQKEPRGFVDDANAAFLIEHLTRDGRIDTSSELEALVGVLQKAKRCPERLVRFALETIRDTVLEGSGPARRGGTYQPGVVTAADVDLIRRVLYAYGGDQHIAVSRAEAEVLFDINDATTEAENDPSWSDLFVKAVANSVLFYSGYTVPTREEALRRDQWLDQPADVGGFFTRMVEGLGRVFADYEPPSPRDRGRLDWSAANVAAAHRVTEDEAGWLLTRLERDQTIHENERALLLFLREKAVHVHPALQPALAAVS